MLVAGSLGCIEGIPVAKRLSLYKQDTKLLAAGMDNPAKPGHKPREFLLGIEGLKERIAPLHIQERTGSILAIGLRT